MMSLAEARLDVDGWLDEVKLKTGKCSGLLRNEIAEGIRRTGTKSAQPLKYELSGLMHKHYKTSSMPDFMLNIENHWRRKSSKAERHRIESEFQCDGHAGRAAHEIVLGGYQTRHGADQMTGEWIVYAEAGGVNYYLTLATHNEPASAVKERVRSCFVEFPELGAQLAW